MLIFFVKIEQIFYSIYVLANNVLAYNVHNNLAYNVCNNK